MVYLDFKKSFYTNSHPELLYKLWMISIKGRLWLWFKAYLNRRTHLVSVEGSLSHPLPVHSGVIQGSVLGPLFFIFINDVPNATCLTATLLFAEDSKLLHAISDSCCSTQLQQDLDTLALWCSTWKLSLNTIKCAAMRFSLSNSCNCIIYFINGEPIKCVKHHKDLGILLTNNITWSKHNIICVSITSSYLPFHLFSQSYIKEGNSFTFPLFIAD